MKDGDASCCSLDTESCTIEESRLRGFCDGNVIEVSVERSGEVWALDFPDFLASFAIPAVASLKALAAALVASLSVLSGAFLASLIL
jgi:hypothetical protein